MRRYVRVVPAALVALAVSVRSASAQAVESLTRGERQIEFVENGGQWPADALWLARTPGLDFWVSRRGFVLDTYRDSLAPRKDERLAAGAECAIVDADRGGRARTVREGHVVSLELEGADLEQRAIGEQPRDGVRNFLLGSVERHVAGLRPWGQVQFADVWPRIDLRLLGDGGRPRYDFLVEPGGDVADIVLRVRGADAIEMAADGTLVLETVVGPVVLGAPRAFQDLAGGRRVVPSRYRWLGDGRIGFDVDGYDVGAPLVIDPTVFATVLGGNGEDTMYGVEVAPNGDSIVVGDTASSNFPITSGAYSVGASFDTTLSRFSSAGARIYSTRIGGTNVDHAWDVALDIAGAIWISGYTNSADFPTAGLQISSTLNSSGDGYGDGFLCAVDGSGSALLFGTFLGGGGGDVARAIEFDATGDLMIAGTTGSNVMPVTATAVQPTRAGLIDGYVARFDLVNGIEYFTFFGGAGYDIVRAMATGGIGDFVCVGYTDSTDFPVSPGAFDLTHNSPAAVDPGNRDGFVFRIDEAAATSSATYFGGGYRDQVMGCVVEPGAGDVVVAGYSGGTTITPLPSTPGSYQPTTDGTYDGFVASFAPDLGALNWSTWLGGSSTDVVLALARGPAGNYWVTGYTHSSDFPNTTTSLYRERSDVLLAVIDSSGASLEYATLRGGSGYEAGWDIAVDSQGRATICGETDSAPHPPGPFVFPWVGFPASRRYGTPLSTIPGVWEGFVMRIQTNVTPTVAASSTNIGGTCAPAGYEATLYVSPPFVGQPFTYSVSGQPSGVAEVYFGGVGQFAVPPCTILIAPGTLAVLGGFTLDANGYGSLDTVLPALPGLLGVTLRAQAVVLGPGGSLFGAGISNAMEFTLGQ